jgi:hypothetical protein
MSYTFLGSARALAQEASHTPSPAPSSSGLLGRLNEAFLPIFALVLLVAFTWSVLLFYDLFISYRMRQRMWGDLLKRVEGNLTEEQIKGIGELLSQAPLGARRGLARTTIALTVATIVSVTLILLLLGGQPEDRELVKTIVTALVAAFTTIIGFYFGARTASEGTADATEAMTRAADAASRR